MANNLSGYFGIFKSPLGLQPRFGNSLYCISDSNKTTLVCIVLSPDAIADLYNLCKTISYQYIYIVPISMDIIFSSSICNTILYLQSIKPNIKWIYPKKIANTVASFEDKEIVATDYVFNNLNGTSISFIQCDLSMNGILTETDLSRSLYDIQLFDGFQKIYFVNYYDLTKATMLYNDTTINQIHTSYDTTLFGGLTYKELLTTNISCRSKYYAHSFTDLESYEMILESSAYHTGPVIYSYLV